ncbi:MAG: hypothetical protein LH624_13875 [Cryobacterium sp.]|nr:hypothetical protein [Cryobacterium sp.]
MFCVLAVLVAGVTVADLTARTTTSPAAAVSGAGFDPGYIISDSEFYDGYTMTAPEVQAFLTARVPVCTGSRGCLSTYVQTTSAIAGDRYCDGYRRGVNESAATIIVKVARSCGINPKGLLVLLEKEQGLVTSRAPSAWAFSAATGMSCPDTAPCDPAVAGFFYQVYYGARQYQIYRAFPTSFNHRAGRTNEILYHPNGACGRRSVFIQNDATAGLYNYTPYTPNVAALANMYGVGDTCSSYGNRNFWRIYSDWFGSPTAGGTLLTFDGTSKTFLLVGSGKFEILDPTVRAAFSTFGPVRNASVEFLRSFETRGVIASPVVKHSDGRIGLVDGGTFRPMSTCAVVAHYGYDCAGVIPQLSAFQSLSLTNGAVLRTYVQTATGQRFVVRDGVRREVLDDASLQAESISGTFVTVGARSVAALPLGAPVVRDGAIFSSSDGAVALFAAGAVREIGPFTAGQIGAAARNAGILAATSVSLLPRGEQRFDGVVRGSEGVSVLTGLGRVRWSDDAVPLPQTPVTVPDWLVSSYPLAASVSTGSVVQALGASTSYVVGESSVRRVISPTGLTAAAVVGLPTVIVRGLPKGPDFLPTGNLMRSSSSASVFAVDGEQRIRVLSMAVPRELGFGPLVNVPDATLASYPLTGAALSWAVQCNGQVSIGVSGQLRPLTPELAPSYGLPVTSLSTATCAQLTTASPMSEFIRVNRRSIYQVEDGTLRQVLSMTRWAEIRGDQTFVDVTSAFAAVFPSGPPA